MSSIVRAVDVGRGNTKYTTGNVGSQISCAMFPSIAHATEPQRARAADTERDTVLVAVERLVYEVGPEIHLGAQPYNAQVLQHDRYTEAPEYLALILGALHYMQCPAIDLLVVGLPVASSKHSNVVSSLESRLAGPHALADGRKVDVRAVKVLPQPAGAIMFVAKSQDRLEALLAQKTLVIDPGHRTFDWLFCHGMRQVERRSNSLPRGMYDVLLAISEAISANVGTQFRDFDAIDRALRGGPKPVIFQKEYDIGRHLKLAGKVAEQAVAEMLHYVGDASDILNILLVGGGAFFYLKAVKKAFPRHRIEEVADPVFANVRGFHLAGVELVRTGLAGRIGEPQHEPDLTNQSGVAAHGQPRVI
ncbi:PRTRC system protein D [Rugamonas aquatica]|uniref:PRTRC system protein D n=1 Tax=Rugamonas aquatica TaxID=2743357 RepID=A0A6A7N618_9BURK|nr:PRTRC system protein D [Rugamonas aquatica]MQA40575.1 PRTRC system protein D [Rugamonas aquatica]